MPIETTPFDAARFLKTREARVEFLLAAFETCDRGFINRSLATLARARALHGGLKPKES